ncbi:MAG: helix-turn-helix domain-containing protein [Candidatus Heimdallarchaeaceae archaeon]|jgi:sugar-specific transcriptional regulator TrmB
MSFIERLQLNPEEKQIYQLLLGGGQLTTFEITQFSKLHFSKVKVALDSLLNKGAVGASEGYVKKYYVKIPLDYLGTTSDQLSESAKSTLDQTASFLQEKKDTFNQLKGNLSASLDESVSRKESELDQKLTHPSSSIQTLNQQQKEDISEKTGVFSSKILSDQDNHRRNVQTTLQSVFTDSLESLNKSKASIDSSVSNIKAKNEENLTIFTAEIDETSQTSIENISTIAQIAKPKFDAMNQQYLNDIDLTIEQIKQNIDTTKMDVRAFNRSQTEKYVGYSTEITRDTEQTIEGISETVSSSLTELNNSLEMALNNKVEDLSLQIKESLSALNEKISQIKVSLLEELMQQKNQVISSSISQIRESMNLKFTDLENKEQTQKNNLVSERDMFIQKLDAQYTTAINEYNEKINEVKEVATTRFSGFEDSLIEQINATTEEIVNSIRVQLTKFKELSTQLNTTLDQDLTTESASLKETWGTISQRLDFLSQETETKLNEKYDESKSSLQSTISEVVSGLNNHLQKTMESALNISKDAIDSSKNGIRESKELVSGTLTEEVDSSVKFIEDSERKLTDTANYLISATMKLKNDFRTLEATSSETQIPPVQTTSIVGLEAVLEHVSRIVKDTKRGVTIMVPKIEYIPTDSIKQLPATAKVTIITSLDEEIDRDWINTITDAQANVELRKLRDTGTGVEIPRFIGVERENEEVLIAAQDEATNEVVGILSRSTYFAKLVSYIVISDFGRGRSSQVK